MLDELVATIETLKNSDTDSTSEKLQANEIRTRTAID